MGLGCGVGHISAMVNHKSGRILIRSSLAPQCMETFVETFPLVLSSYPRSSHQDPHSLRFVSVHGKAALPAFS